MTARTKIATKTETAAAEPAKSETEMSAATVGPTETATALGRPAGARPADRIPQRALAAACGAGPRAARAA